MARGRVTKTRARKKWVDHQTENANVIGYVLASQVGGGVGTMNAALACDGQCASGRKRGECVH